MICLVVWKSDDGSLSSDQYIQHHFNERALNGCIHPSWPVVLHSIAHTVSRVAMMEVINNKIR